jgi:hypothetical protein
MAYRINSRASSAFQTGPSLLVNNLNEVVANGCSTGTENYSDSGQYGGVLTTSGIIQVRARGSAHDLASCNGVTPAPCWVIVVCSRTPLVYWRRSRSKKSVTVSQSRLRSYGPPIIGLDKLSENHKKVHRSTSVLNWGFRCTDRTGNILDRSYP